MIQHLLPAAYAANRVYSRSDYTAGSDHALYYTAGGHSYLAFRGTDSLSDWTSNLHIRKTYHPVLGYVHSGFLDAALSFTKQLRPASQTIITGHSRGAAIALLFAALHSCPCITFAAPKVGIMIPHTAVTMYGDLVPFTPFSYRNENQNPHLHLRPNCKQPCIWNPTIGKQIQDAIKSTVKHIGTRGLAAAQAHSMTTYLEAIRCGTLSSS